MMYCSIATDDAPSILWYCDLRLTDEEVGGSQALKTELSSKFEAYVKVYFVCGKYYIFVYFLM